MRRKKECDECWQGSGGRSANILDDVGQQLTDCRAGIDQARRDFSSLDDFRSDGRCHVGLHGRMNDIRNSQSACLDNLRCSADHEEYHERYKDDEIFGQARYDIAMSEEVEG